jgi:hypothetical protein
MSLPIANNPIIFYFIDFVNVLELYSFEFNLPSFLYYFWTDSLPDTKEIYDLLFIDLNITHSHQIATLFFMAA